MHILIGTGSFAVFFCVVLVYSCQFYSLTLLVFPPCPDHSVFNLLHQSANRSPVNNCTPQFPLVPFHISLFVQTFLQIFVSLVFCFLVFIFIVSCTVQFQDR